MKKILMFIVTIFSICFFASCDKPTETGGIPTKPVVIDDTKFELIWDKSYQDSKGTFTENSVKSSKLFYEGEYVPLDTNVSKRK